MGKYKAGQSCFDFFFTINLQNNEQKLEKYTKQKKSTLKYIYHIVIMPSIAIEHFGNK